MAHPSYHTNPYKLTVTIETVIYLDLNKYKFPSGKKEKEKQHQSDLSALRNQQHWPMLILIARKKKQFQQCLSLASFVCSSSLSPDPTLLQLHGGQRWGGYLILPTDLHSKWVLIIFSVSSIVTFLPKMQQNEWKLDYAFKTDKGFSHSWSSDFSAKRFSQMLYKFDCISFCILRYLYKMR